VCSSDLLLAGASPALAQAIAASAPVTEQARAIFEKDWVLMNWALKFYDENHDILLEPDEAQAAATEFRKLADKDGDGRVTPDEYRAARQAILTSG